MLRPPMIAYAFKCNTLGSSKNYNVINITDCKIDISEVVERKDFVNAQWAIGPKGSGAPVHYHNAAWNALVYGAKKWFLYTPHNNIMSNKQIFQFVEEDVKSLELEGATYRTCVQTAGDVIIVPDSWAHGVLNIQDSVAVATETTADLFRPDKKYRF